MLRQQPDERRTEAYDAPCLAEDHFDATRVALVGGRDLPRLLGRLDAVEVHDATLDLGDGLLRDDDDVSVLELGAVQDHAGEVVALAQLGDALDGEDRERRHSPTMSRPA